MTTVTGERSFSALKYIMNYLRSTMGEERLNGLAHMYINRDISLNYETVIDEFGKFNRRLSFVLCDFKCFLCSHGDDMIHDCTSLEKWNSNTNECFTYL